MIVYFVTPNGLACYFIYILILRLKMCAMHQGVLGLVMYEGQLIMEYQRQRTGTLRSWFSVQVTSM